MIANLVFNSFLLFAKNESRYPIKRYNKIKAKIRGIAQVIALLILLISIRECYECFVCVRHTDLRQSQTKTETRHKLRRGVRKKN